MNGRIELHMDTLSIFGLSNEPDAKDTKQLQETIESGLHKLAERLAGSPFERMGVRELAIEQLSLGALSADELLGERGAERFADELYSALRTRLK